MTIFIRLLEAEDKESALRSAIAANSLVQSQSWFEVAPSNFSGIPRTPFVYWVSKEVREVFRNLPKFESESRTAKQGLATADDFRFVRLHWEIPGRSLRCYWYPFVKGGSFSPFYGDISLQVNWQYQGAEICNFRISGTDRVASRPQNTNYFFRPGLTWPARPHKRGAFSHVPKGCIFSHTGTMLFLPTDVHWSLCSILNSDSYIGLLHLLMPRGGNDSGQTLKYEIGYVVSVPIPSRSREEDIELAFLGRRAWELKRDLDTRTETSHAFVLPALLLGAAAPSFPPQPPAPGPRSQAWAARVRAAEAELAEIQAEIDGRCFDLYGISEEDRLAITRGFGGGSETAVVDLDGDSPEPPDGADDEEPEGGETCGADPAVLAAELVSWTVGVAFGRFDLRLATGERPAPPVPEPFDPLPVCSPGMLTGANGLPLAAPPAGYPVAFPADGILVADRAHPRDLAAAVGTVFALTFGPSADAFQREAADLLESRDGDLRAWLARDFFPDHLKRYSKSRRKAPIYWPLSTASGAYTLWIYYHRLTDQTLFTCVTEYVEPKIADTEKDLARLRANLGEKTGPKERKQVEDLQDFLAELKDFRDELLRVAKLPFKPDLNDGVMITAAPLAKLFLHKPWQKELAACWKKLAAGDYDWAHLALSIWGPRVREKCKTDKSLAIAHDLESLYVEPPPSAKKSRPRKKPIIEEEDLPEEEELKPHPERGRHEIEDKNDPRP